MGATAQGGAVRAIVAAPMRLVLALLVLAACRDRAAAPPPRAADAAATATTAPADAAAAPIDASADAAPVGPALAPITVDEVKVVVPVPAEARVLRPHGKDAGRERIEVTFCFERGEVPALAARIADKLRAHGWTVSAPMPPRADRADVAAERGDLRLAGMLRRGPWVECPGQRGQVYGLIGVHRPAP